MSDVIPLFELNPSLDREALARQFRKQGRLQIRNFLEEGSARAIHQILARQTEWGLAWQAGEDGPHGVRRQQLAAMTPQQRQAIGAKVDASARGSDYAFLYGYYPMLDAYLEEWRKGSPQDLLLEHINDQPIMSLVREVSGISELIKADAQASLYGPHHFLSAHDDSHKAEGRRVAYVMNFCLEDWRPEWGGYLLFYDDDGDVVTGFRPRFNALNLFLVPQQHGVSYVPGFAPVGRYAITGWFRDI